MIFQHVKCNRMQLTRKQTKTINVEYTLKSTILRNVDTIKYLEVTITEDLKWNIHVSNICTKASRKQAKIIHCPHDVRGSLQRTGASSPGPEVIKLFSCSTQRSPKFQLLINTKIPTHTEVSCYNLSDIVFIMLINVKMPKICGILKFMSRINFVLS